MVHSVLVMHWGYGSTTAFSQTKRSWKHSAFSFYTALVHRWRSHCAPILSAQIIEGSTHAICEKINTCTGNSMSYRNHWKENFKANFNKISLLLGKKMANRSSNIKEKNHCIIVCIAVWWGRSTCRTARLALLEWWTETWSIWRIWTEKRARRMRMSVIFDLHSLIVIFGP